LLDYSIAIGRLQQHLYGSDDLLWRFKNYNA